MYNLNCIIIIIFNCSRAYARDYTLISINCWILYKADEVHLFLVKNQSHNLCFWKGK